MIYYLQGLSDPESLPITSRMSYTIHLSFSGSLWIFIFNYVSYMFYFHFKKEPTHLFYFVNYHVCRIAFTTILLADTLSLLQIIISVFMTNVPAIVTSISNYLLNRNHQRSRQALQDRPGSVVVFYHPSQSMSIPGPP